MAAIDGVGYKNLSKVPFKGEEQERSSGMGMGVPIVATLGGGALGYWAFPGKIDEDTFQKKAVADEKIEYTKELDESEKALEKAAIAEAKEKEKAKASESKDAPKTDAKTEPAKPEVKTGAAAAEAPAAEVKTPAQEELEANVKHFFGDNLKEIHPETLIEGHTVEDYGKRLEVEEKTIEKKQQGTTQLKETLKEQEDALRRTQDIYAQELDNEGAKSPKGKELAQKERKARLDKATKELEKLETTYNNDVKEALKGHSKKDSLEAQIEAKKAEIVSLTEEMAPPYEKALAKSEVAVKTAQTEVDKAAKKLADAKLAAAKDATSQVAKDALQAAEKEFAAKKVSLKEAKDILKIQQITSVAGRKRSFIARINDIEQAIKDSQKSIKRNEAEIEKALKELATKRTYLSLAKEAGTGRVSRETFIQRVGNGIKLEMQKLAEVTGGKPAEAAKEGETAVQKFLKAVAEKLPKNKTVTRGLVGAGIGLVAGLVIKWIFGGKSEA